MHRGCELEVLRRTLEGRPHRCFNFICSFTLQSRGLWATIGGIAIVVLLCRRLCGLLAAAATAAAYVRGRFRRPKHARVALHRR